MEDDGKFFVVNEDDNDTAPRKIHFELQKAIDEDSLYIDVFDENGNRLCHYERDGKEYVKYMDV